MFCIGLKLIFLVKGRMYVKGCFIKGWAIEYLDPRRKK
jgi:hypothetical protein